MNFYDKKVTDINIAYIGGGSRGWAWGLMSDLVSYEDISGTIRLYDIDYEAAKANEIIGNKFNSADGAKTRWDYVACKDAREAYEGADFVIISILPGTFDEMESDVHLPEQYGIYQSVGDTAGPGGVIRAMRTVPMFEEIAENIKEYCPNAWVINYTNPMTLCVKTLYRVFPEIKAFGCCHEVFGTQKLLAKIINNEFGIPVPARQEIKVNPIGVNHFTWITDAKYRNIDLFPIYKKFCLEHKEGAGMGEVDKNWMNSTFKSDEAVKMELFLRYGVIAAAGDRHLAEFCEGKWYLESPESVKQKRFGLTTVQWRKNDLLDRLAKSKRLVSGEEPVTIKMTGEEGVIQMRALLGLCEIVTNVNIPNRGQIPNLPLGAVVESNAVFRAGDITPVFAGDIPSSIYPMIARVCGQQQNLDTAIAERDLDKIFNVFANEPLTTCSLKDAKELFDRMCQNTKKYLTMYNL